MATYKVKENFKGSPDGMQVIEFSKGSTVELTGDLEKIALEEKWVAKSRKTAAEKAAEAKHPEQSKQDDSFGGDGATDESNADKGDVDDESGDGE